MRGGEPRMDEWGDQHPNAWGQRGSEARAGAEAGEPDGSATSAPAVTGWLSPTPGVFRRAAAPEGLGAIRGAARVAAPHGGAPGSGRRVGGGLWRVVGVAVVAVAVVVVVLGLARVAGTGHGAGAVPVGWEPSGSSGSTAHPRSASPPAPSTSGASGAGATPVPATSSTSPAQHREADWWSVLAELDRRRSVALAATDPALLGDYAQPGSPAWDSDEALILDLSARGLVPEGLTTRVLAIEGVAREGARVTLQAVDRRSGYTLVDDEGVMAQAVERGLPSRWAITLAQVAPDGAIPDEAALDGAGPGGAGQNEDGLDAAGPDERGRTAGAVRDPADRGERSVDPGSDPGWRVVQVVPRE